MFNDFQYSILTVDLDISEKLQNDNVDKKVIGKIYVGYIT